MPLNPVTRVENFLARIAGDPGAILTPITRIEKFLQRIIDTGGGGGGGPDSNAVHYTADSGKTASEKTQARANIDAAATSDIPDVSGLEPKKLVVAVTVSSGTYVANKTFSQMWTAFNGGRTVSVEMGDAEFVLSAAAPAVMAFTSVSVGSGNATLSMLTVDENDDWSYAEFAAGVYTVTVSGSTPIITPADNTIYKCGELTSLTVSNPPATGNYIIVFTSGSTATTTTIPSSVKFPTSDGSFAAEANTRYEINVSDGYAVVGEWPVPSV